MKEIKIIFSLLMCMTWAFDCYALVKKDKDSEFGSSSLFEQKCSNCHEAKKSAMLLKDERAWENTILRMSKKQGAEMTSSDVEKLVRIHVERQRAERNFFLEECTRCHEAGTSLSDIKTTREWKKTIRRMMAKAKKDMSTHQIDLLIGYHVRYQNRIMAKCARCHDLNRVVALERDEEAWRKIVTAMSKQKGSDISEDDINIIVRYHQQRQQKNRELFETKCSNCHERMHMQSPPTVEKTPDQWRATIRRMMEKTGEGMSDENIDTLIHYHIRAHTMITFGKLEAQSTILGLRSTTLFERKCSICHSLEKALQTIKDEASWEKTIQAMAKKRGSSITASDVSELVNFHVARQKQEQKLFLRDCSPCHPADIALESGKTHEQWRDTAMKMMGRAGKKISQEELDILTRYHVSYENTMESLFIKKCTRCHDRKRILTTKGTPQSLKRIIVEMSEKEGSDITAPDIRRLVDYHVAKQKIEQEVFLKDCSKCHKPEETFKEKKSRDEWRETIRRMMAKTDKMITDEELDILINYHIRRTRYGE